MDLRLSVSPTCAVDVAPHVQGPGRVGASEAPELSTVGTVTGLRDVELNSTGWHARATRPKPIVLLLI